jgi:hypothetical protein
MTQLNSIFKNETANLKTMYSRYGRQREYADVEMAERLYDQTKASGEAAFANIRSAQQQASMPVRGGRGKKPKQTKKK